MPRKAEPVGHDERMSFTEGNLQQTVRHGVARMGKRRRVVSGIYRFAGRDPETAAHGLIVLATRERDRLHAELQAIFGFSVVRGSPKASRCRFTSPGRRPKTPEEKAAWLDGLVLLRGLRAGSRCDARGCGRLSSHGRGRAKRGGLRPGSENATRPR